MTNSLLSRLLLLRRFSPFSIPPAKPFNRRNSIFSDSINFFSTQDQPKPSSLSARMSFVFDQIDQIEKQRRDQFHQNDDTLQRIRAWRQSKRESQETLDRKLDSTAAGNDADFVDSSESDKNGDTLQRIRAWRQSNYSENMAYMDPETSGSEGKFSTVAEPVGELDGEDECSEVGKKGKEAELVHPWPEWIELMERLVQQNYFDHKRRDENRMMRGVGFDVSNVGDEVSDDAGIDFRDYKTVQLACINFGKDRFDILRSMSRQDIQILVGYGCPTTDKKVVFSAKLLRKRVHLDEGDVCSSCSLRSTCSLAYLLTNKEDEARTIDVMRVLTIYGFDYVNGCVGNKGLLKQKSVKTVARKLLHEVVKLSAVPIDPNLPPPVIKKAPPKVKQPPPPPKKRVGRDDIEMKKGDWLCTKCDFMNFAKNTVCLQCDAKRPKRQLLPGEWECPECNFLNYRRNMACFHCDCKRPPDTFMENEMRQKQPGPRTGMEKGSRQQVVSNAWNFDFDDDESDGADIAAFENADPVMDGESPEAGINGGNYRGFEDDFNNGGRVHRKEREFSDHGRNQPGTGFDDFDDFDDIDSYEIDTEISKPAGKASSNDFSDIDEFSESEDRRGSINSSRREMVQPYSKPSKSFSKKASGFSDSDMDFDSDGELSVPPNWKGSHVAGSRHKSSSARNSRKGLSFGSDDDPELNSDTDNDDYVPRHTKGNDRSYSRGGFQRAGRFDDKGGSFSDSDLESDGRRFQRNRSRGSKTTGVGGRGNNFSGRKDYDLDEDVGTRSDRKMGNQRNGGFEGSSKGFRSDNRFKGDDFTDRRGNSREADKRGKGFRDRRGGNDDYGSRRMNNRGDENKRGQGFRSQPHRRSDKHDGGGGDWSPSDFRNSRRVIER